MKKRFLSGLLAVGLMMSFMGMNVNAAEAPDSYLIDGVTYNENGGIYDDSLGLGTFTVSGNAPDITSLSITTLDVTIPVSGVQFVINGDGEISSQGMVITSNTSAPVNIDVIRVDRLDEGDTTNDLEATTVKSPALVKANTYDESGWNNLTVEETNGIMALALKQVDIIDGVASDSLTDATTDSLKVTTPVELGDLASNYRLAHIQSGFSGPVSVGINIDKNFTKYGKQWFSTKGVNFRYLVTVEFTVGE